MNLLMLVAILAFSVLCVIDWKQTRTIAKNPTKFYEINPILGKHPSVKKVDIYFAVVFGITIACVLWLPDTYLFPLSIVAALVEAAVVYNNTELGIEMD